MVNRFWGNWCCFEDVEKVEYKFAQVVNNQSHCYEHPDMVPSINNYRLMYGRQHYSCSLYNEMSHVVLISEQQRMIHPRLQLIFTLSYRNGD